MYASLLTGQTSTSVSKSCGACNAPVSEFARVGQTCPHCGVTWGDETTTQTTSYSSEYDYLPSNYPDLTEYTIDPPNYGTSTWPSSSYTGGNSRSRSTAVQFHNKYSQKIRLRFERQLKQAGYFHGLVDGTFDSSTVSAVRRFQASMGLSQDGRIGPNTMRYLSAYTN